MRAVCAVLALLAAILVCAQVAAQEARVLLAERIQDLNLTDEQEAKIAAIQNEGRPKIEAAARDLAAVVKEEVDKVKAVLTPGQKEQLANLREERKEYRAEGLSERVARLEELDLSDGEIAQIEAIRKEFHPQVVKAMEELRGILTNEQRRVREQALQSGKRGREVLVAMNLTEEQKEKVLAACKEATGAVRTELEKIRDVLTAQQQAKLPELRDERKEHVRDRMAHRVANLKELNLTPDQLAKIGDIRKEYRPKVHEAGNKLRAAIRDDVQAVAAVIRG